MIRPDIQDLIDCLNWKKVASIAVPTDLNSVISALPLTI
jgi:hypothetical protein